MIILLSPAKKMGFDQTLTADDWSLPGFADKSRILAERMRKMAPNELKKAMKISDNLALLNFERWQNWNTPEKPEADCAQAIAVFQGDVYQGLDATNWTAADLQHAQQNLRILSGLHGLLRPLDLIKPYRLEMGTRLANPMGKDLYAFWRANLGQYLSQALREQEAPQHQPWILNLASREYAQAAALDELAQQGVQIISPCFENQTAAGWRTVMFYAKRSRGAMAAWVIKNNIKQPQQINQYCNGGYQYQPSLSTPEQPVFRAEAQKV